MLRRVWRETLDDHVFIYASALSYSWLFAFFPMLIFLVSLIPFLPHDARVAGQELIFKAIEKNFPQQTAEWILNNTKLKTILESTLHERRGAVASASLAIALWAASNGISSIMIALDKCYEIEKGRPYYRSKPISLLLTAVLTVLALLVMTLIPIGTFAKSWILSQGGGITIPFTEIKLSFWMVLGFDLARYAVGLSAGFLALSLIYNFCPSVKMRWRFVSPGAVFCFASWVLIGLAFKVYLSLTGGTTYSQTFGPAAGLAMLLLNFYLYGVVLLVGAEINSEIDYTRLKVEPGTRDMREAERVLRLAERQQREKLSASSGNTTIVSSAAGSGDVAGVK